MSALVQAKWTGTNGFRAPFRECVTDAERVSGLSRTGVVLMRQKFPAFAAAWDEATTYMIIAPKI